ncbi:hypothetical protein, partial [Arthrobacter woluwensis]|uniref:hypothetical protein n=1 Tax=Arthrobacter woluwensis TaxID=156980 RepID=UPI001114B6A9
MGALLAVLGGGIRYLIGRSDKKREKREASVEELLRERIEALEAELKEAKLVKRAAGKWREQLIAAGIEPDPKTGRKECHEPARRQREAAGRRAGGRGQVTPGDKRTKSLLLLSSCLLAFLVVCAGSWHGRTATTPPRPPTPHKLRQPRRNR